MVGGNRFLMADATENDLIAAVGRAELDALGEIYRRHGAAVLAAARRVAPDPLTAETVTADVFVQLWDHPQAAAAHRDGVRAYLVACALTLVADDDLRPTGD
ncbi:MAG: polymerase sigma-70 factor, subfamily [Pseudonocardiales bacterium]|nr:polymerase sigma-70 factor, subfamily [Pseudonocardiales bacterium]